MSKKRFASYGHLYRLKTKQSLYRKLNRTNTLRKSHNANKAGAVKH